MAAKTKWQLKREASYTALLDAAMHGFHDRGYAATTVGDIVEDAGYTSGAFYFHFKDKSDCFWHVVAHREGLRGPWWEVVLAGLDPETTSLEEVLGRAFAHFSEVHDGLDEWVLVMVDFHQQHRGDPEVQARLAEVYACWQSELRSFLAILAERGWIAGDRDPAVLSTQIFAFGEGVATHTSLYELDEEAIQAALIDGLVRLLR